jgi:hypothetical protein
MHNAINSQNIGSVVVQRDIFRLAALLYAETNNTVTTSDTKLHIAKCVFAGNGNAYLSYEETISAILEKYKTHFTVTELKSIVSATRNVFIESTQDAIKVICLCEETYKNTQACLEKTIDYYIDEFISVNSIEDSSACREAIYQYIYELTTTNINSYRVLLNESDGSLLHKDELSIDVEILSDVERVYVRDFLIWDNPEKNNVVSHIILCCLEYCLLISGDKPSSYLIRIFRDRDAYIDTNIIFRALGINGASRKAVIDSFLKKCRQAKVNVKIARFTKNEFFSTVDYYIGKIAEVPRGKTYPVLLEQISDYSIFSYYTEWVSTHPGLSLVYFRNYIQSSYKKMIRDYNIVDDEETPHSIYNSEEFQQGREDYASAIQNAKRSNGYTPNDTAYWTSGSDKHDASVIKLIEMYRNSLDVPSKVFFVSSDNVLRYWDMSREGRKYPVVIYPSQLFLVLIKMCGRAENDFDSFVSFINIRSHSKHLSIDKANIVISAISSITEDLKTQTDIVSTVFDDEFQNILRNTADDESLYKSVQEFSQNYLKKELEQQKSELEKATLDIGNLNEKVDNLEQSILSTNAQNEEHSKRESVKNAHQMSEQEQRKRNLCEFAERKTAFVYLLKWYAAPIAVCVLSLAIIAFIGLQFFYKDADWNFSTNLIDCFRKTYFWELSGEGALIAMDTAFGGFLLVIWKFSCKLFFCRNEKAIYRGKLVEEYIDKHKLL